MRHARKRTPATNGTPNGETAPKPHHEIRADHWARIYVGDCRELLPRIPESAAGKIDLVFADPPFNWKRGYDEWHDDMPEDEYLAFTWDWLDLCVKALRPGGALWVNIPDNWAAEVACYLKGRMDRRPPAPMSIVNWCIWHYRFGQNRTEQFINSKVHVFYFLKGGGERTWNPKEVLELSDRRAIYFDPRTESKRDGMPAGHRLPMDVWYGQYWGRVQGNNKERRGYHDNQLPEAYLERVIRATSNEGDLVMDPFLGSGTTGVIAHALKRRFIGTEFSAASARSAFERMKRGPVRIGKDGSGPASTAIFQARKRKSSNRASGDDTTLELLRAINAAPPSPLPHRRRSTRGKRRHLTVR